MIWEDDKPDHDAHGGTGLLIALPIALMLWSVVFWGLNTIYEWMQNSPCGG